MALETGITDRLALVMALALALGLVCWELSVALLVLLCALAFGDLAEVPWCQRTMRRLDGRKDGP